MESEQLLAQALRAQAASTPAGPPGAVPELPTAALRPSRPASQLPAGWVLAIALLLGLLGGALAGVVSML